MKHSPPNEKIQTDLIGQHGTIPAGKSTQAESSNRQQFDRIMNRGDATRKLFNEAIQGTNLKHNTHIRKPNNNPEHQRASGKISMSTGTPKPSPKKKDAKKKKWRSAALNSSLNRQQREKQKDRKRQAERYFKTRMQDHGMQEEKQEISFTATDKSPRANRKEEYKETLVREANDPRYSSEIRPPTPLLRRPTLRRFGAESNDHDNGNDDESPVLGMPPPLSLRVMIPKQSGEFRSPGRNSPISSPSYYDDHVIDINDPYHYDTPRDTPRDSPRDTSGYSMNSPQDLPSPGVSGGGPLQGNLAVGFDTIGLSTTPSPKVNTEARRLRYTEEKNFEDQASGQQKKGLRRNGDKKKKRYKKLAKQKSSMSSGGFESPRWSQMSLGADRVTRNHYDNQYGDQHIIGNQYNNGDESAGRYSPTTGPYGESSSPEHIYSPASENYSPAAGNQISTPGGSLFGDDLSESLTQQPEEWTASQLSDLDRILKEEGLTPRNHQQ
eukprot:g2053.t1